VVVEVGRDSRCEDSSEMTGCAFCIVVLVGTVSGFRLMIGLMSVVETLFERSTVLEVEEWDRGS
jgi:hypothetical protein